MKLRSSLSRTISAFASDPFCSFSWPAVAVPTSGSVTCSLSGGRVGGRLGWTVGPPVGAEGSYSLGEPVGDCVPRMRTSSRSVTLSSVSYSLMSRSAPMKKLMPPVVTPTAHDPLPMSCFPRPSAANVYATLAALTASPKSHVHPSQIAHPPTVVGLWVGSGVDGLDVGCGVLGLLDGAFVGLTDGTAEGETVGLWDGAFVGLTDGDAEGETVGDVEGCLVGEIDGLALGETEGLADGLALGEMVGLVVGYRDGDVVGEIDGNSVGVLLGLAVGDRLGAAEGECVGEIDGNAVGRLSWNQRSYCTTMRTWFVQRLDDVNARVLNA